jgi:predicted transcriptional regulator
MPYESFLEAARSERYDIVILSNRFRTSFEQVCHRLTTLHRPGAEGVPFHFVRIDVAGNISKRFSATGFRFARFSGACPRWNVFAAFLTPGMIRTQLSQMPDGSMYFWVARTIRKDAAGYRAPHTVFAVGIGCDVRDARKLVYADGVNVESRETAVPVGVTCRLCDRMDCEQRAFPSLQHPLKLDEHVRGISFYAPVAPRQPLGD